MKRLVSNVFWGTALVIACTVSLALVIFSVLSSADIEFDDAQKVAQEVWSRLTPQDRERPTQRSDEVRSYTLFTEVGYGELNVTTGIRYASTMSPNIETQWCYIAAKADAGHIYDHLTLATKDPDGGLVVPSFQNSALAKFSLTQSSVQDLIGTHCRFH